MGRRARRLGVPLAVVLLAAIPLLNSGSVQGAPTEKEPHDVSERATFPAVGVVLEPPARGYTPEIDAAEAYAKARSLFPESAGASSLEAMLGVYTSEMHRDEKGAPMFQEVPAWTVVITGICVPIYGGVPLGGEKADTAEGPECGGQEMNVVLDASSGELLEAFSYR